MPYIAIKAYHKDDAVKKRTVERIHQVFLEEWGCPPDSVSISVEEYTPEEFREKVVHEEIEPKQDAMLILFGKKRY